MDISDNFKKKLPTRLTPGDTIGIAAPAGSFKPEYFCPGVNLLESMGFDIYLPKDLFQRKGYLAGSDAHRADLLNRLFADTRIKAVFCARGGFGSLRILPLLDTETILQNPKIFIGFSDISAILSLLYTRCGLVTFHGPVITTLGNADQLTIDAMTAAIMSARRVEIKPENGITLKSGRASGPVTGGNLSTLCHLLGTPFQPNFKDHILFLEDISEPSYKIDRMLTQMKLAGCFEGILGLGLGSFEKCGKMDEILKIVGNIFNEYEIPILAGLDAGHGKSNITIPIGLEATLDTDNLKLSFHEPATISRHQTPTNQTPNTKHQTPNTKHQTPNTKQPTNQTPTNQTPNTKHQTPNTKHQTPNTNQPNNQTPNNQTTKHQTPNNQTPNTLMKQAVKDNIFPGGVLLVCQEDEITFFEPYGYANIFSKRRVTRETVFDLASLTKPLATTLAVMKLVQQDRLTIAQPLGSLLPQFKDTEKERITIRHLLTHNSGLPDYRPYYEQLRRLEPEIRETALKEFLVKEALVCPAGEKAVYSDLGFMILRRVIETVSGTRLDRFVDKEIYRPLGLKNLFFRFVVPPLGGVAPPKGGTTNLGFAATELCPWRNMLLEGVVHDDNAYIMGGIEGHAGLFGTAEDICILLSKLLGAFHGRFSTCIFQENTLKEFFKRQPRTGRALGFDMPASQNSSAGRYFSERTVGHLGFTGTSFWADPDRSVIVILLTNRVHPSRNNTKIKTFRPELHDSVMKTLAN